MWFYYRDEGGNSIYRVVYIIPRFRVPVVLDHTSMFYQRRYMDRVIVISLVLLTSGNQVISGGYAQERPATRSNARQRDNARCLVSSVFVCFVFLPEVCPGYALIIAQLTLP